MPFPQRQTDRKKIKNLGEFFLDRSNASGEQSGYVLVLETTGSLTRRTAFKKELKSKGVEHICLLKSYSEVMRLMMEDEQSIAVNLTNKGIGGSQKEMRLQCRLIFLSVGNVADAQQALAIVKEFRSHSRFRSAVIILDFPSIEKLSSDEKDKYTQLIDLAKEARIEASVVSQHSENITRMIETALDYINEKLNDSVYKKLIGIAESVLERVGDPQAPDIALSTFQYSRVQELLYIMKNMSSELKGELKTIEEINSKKKEAMKIVAETQSDHKASYIDLAEGFQKAIDVLKVVILDIRARYSFKTDSRNTYGPRRLVGEGRAHQLKRNYEKTEECLLMALEMMDGKFINALIALSDLYHEINAMDKKIGVLEKANKINPHNICRLTDTAKLHAKCGNRVKAMELVKKAVEEDPEIAALMAGEVCLELGDNDKAQEFFEKSLKREVLSPDDIFHTLNRLAISLRKQKKFDGALSNYQKALKIQRHDPVVHYNMGIVYKLKLETGKAKEHFQEALKLNPDFEEVKREINKVETADEVAS